MSDHSEHHVPVLAVPGTGRKVIVGVVTIGVALVAIFVFGLLTRHREKNKLQLEAQEAADTPAAVEAMHVRRGEGATLLVLPGETRAFYETTLYARTSGYLKNWVVDIGDRVKQGAVLATIETPELDDQLAAATAKVNQQKSEVQLAQASVNFAQLSFDRFESAAPQGAVSAQDRDQKKAELDSAKAKLAAADAQVKLAEAQLKGFQTLIGFKDVIAPFDGVITQRHVDIGDLVTAGSTSSTTPLFSIARSDQIRVFVDVPQSVAPQIKVGMPAAVTTNDAGSRKFEGAVSRTADSIDPVSRTLKVEVLVPNPAYELKPGMYVQSSFKGDRANPPLLIPAAALNMRPSGPEVAVIAHDGTIHFKPVTILHDQGDVIEIGSGLEEGQAVALNIGSDAVDGQKIDARFGDVKEPTPPNKTVTVPLAMPTTRPAGQQATNAGVLVGQSGL